MENTVNSEVQVENTVDGEVQPEKLQFKKIQSKVSGQAKINTWFDSVCPQGTPAERSAALDSLDINDFYQRMLENNPNWSQRGDEKGVKIHFSWYKSNYKKLQGLPKRKVNRLK